MIRAVAAALLTIGAACATARRPAAAPRAEAGSGAAPSAISPDPLTPPEPPRERDGGPVAPDLAAADDADVERGITEDSDEVRELQEADDRERAGAGGGGAAAALAAIPEIGHDLPRLRAEYDIPIDVNETVVRYVRFFLGEDVRPHFARWLARLERYGPRFREILRREGVPEDTVFLALVESGFSNRATSRARAVGAWQFIAETGRRYGLRRDFWVDERRDPEKAAAAAARFLAQLHRAAGDWRLAWAGYNAGPNRIARALEAGHVDFWEMARTDGVLPAETRAYVPKIMAAAIIAKHAREFGFRRGDVEPERWIPYREVVVRGRTALSLLAKAAGVSTDALVDLNPELRRTSTPPRRYRLKIPRERARAFAAAWPRLSRVAAREAARAAAPCARGRAPLPAGTVCVRPGDTLWSISREHGTSVRELARWNGIRDPARYVLRAGAKLMLRARETHPEVAARTE